MKNLTIAKASLRDSMLDHRGRLSLLQQNEAAKRAAARLLNILESFPTLDVGLYWAFKGELSTREIFLEIRKKGKRLYLPRLESKKKALEFVQVSGEEQLLQGPFGIFQPDPNLPSASLKQIGALVIPGVAFDIKGHRLGWGKGYYDRLLKKFNGVRVGFAYDFQVLENIPVEKNDQSVQMIVTDRREIDCAKC